MIRAVVFDLWNTLVHNEGEDPLRRMQRILTPEQAPRFRDLKRAAMDRPHADARTFLEAWIAPLGLSPAQVEAIVAVFRRAGEDAVLYPEADTALQRTRVVARTALLSNTQTFDMGFLDRLGLRTRLGLLQTSADTGFLKPEPEAFDALARRMGLFPGQLAMVGDSWTDDVQGALAAGWTAIWINRDGRPRPDHDPEAELLELPDLGRVAEAVEGLQAGARCATCLG